MKRNVEESYGLFCPKELTCDLGPYFSTPVFLKNANDYITIRKHIKKDKVSQ